MKITKLVAMMFVVGLLSTSCKKEFECNCTTGFSDVVVETHKGKDAKDACDSASKPLQFKVCVPK